MEFFDLLEGAKEKSGSSICVGLDLAIFGSRKEYTLKKGENKQEKILQLIEELSPYCCSYKVNRQYILDLSKKQIQAITSKSHENRRPIIIDHKLSDIGSTNDQALFQFEQEGFDAFTFSPFPGNVEDVCNQARSHGLATIMLVLMSNPEAKWMKTENTKGIPFYQHYSQLVNDFADGAVVGATIGEKELSTIAKEIPNKFILSPGVGPQGGTVEKLLKYFKDNVVFNVGRGIIYHSDPIKELNKYNTMISSVQV